MQLRLRLDMLPQPDETTCGPTCLQAVYAYYRDAIDLAALINEVQVLEGGGTLAVFLGSHALKRGYKASIFTFNLQVFDPTWFAPGAPDLEERLVAQAQAKPHKRRLQVASAAYLDYLRLGGSIHFEDLTTSLIRRHLERGVPILAGLSATYLYRSAREKGSRMDYDDVSGEPAGHFVVLCGYDRSTRSVLVADPQAPNPMAATNQYPVNIDRLVCSILLGNLTYDDNLLLITPTSPP